MKRKELSLNRKESIYNNYVNGNLSDCRKAIKPLTKSQFFDLHEFFRGQGGFNATSGLRQLV